MHPVVLQIVRTAAMTLLGLYAGGVLFVVLAPSVGRLPASAYVPYWQAVNADYGRAMPPFLITCLVLLVTTATLTYGRGRLPFALTVAAGLLVIVTIALTVTQMEPLNRLADGWSADRPPVDWPAIRQRWLTLHTVRTVIALLAFVSLLAANALDRPPAASTTQARTEAEVAA